MANAKYLNATNSSNHSPEFITQLLLSKINNYHKYHESNAQLTYANKRTKNNFYNSVNATMNNPFSPKKKFSILMGLLRTSIRSDILTIIENGDSVTDPKQKADILNRHFFSKATVPGENDNPPNLDKFDVLSDLTNINTSPLELGKIIRELKKSHSSHCGVPEKFFSH